MRCGRGDDDDERDRKEIGGNEEGEYHRVSRGVTFPTFPEKRGTMRETKHERHGNAAAAVAMGGGGRAVRKERATVRAR